MLRGGDPELDLGEKGGIEKIGKLERRFSVRANSTYKGMGVWKNMTYSSNCEHF